MTATFKIVAQRLTEIISSAGNTFISWCEAVGGMSYLLYRIVKALIPPDFDAFELWRHLYKVGVKSFPIVVATATFTGAIMVIQSGHIVRETGATAYVGWGAGIAVLAELGPVLIGLMFSGRVGANNTAELGTMKVTDQIDALRILSIEPIKYLVVPRFLSMIIMLTLLTCIGDLFALLGGAWTSQFLLGIDMRIFFDGIIEGQLLDEFVMGLVKGLFFGGAISVVSCYFGLTVEGGAEGVGRAVNNSVVASAIGIFAINYLITYIWLL